MRMWLILCRIDVAGHDLFDINTCIYSHQILNSTVLLASKTEFEEHNHTIWPFLNKTYYVS